MIDLRLKRLRRVFREYPAPFRTLVVASFIDRLGGALLFPFLTLYITRKFDVGMTEVGIIFALFSLASVGGSFLGGALADKLGRKGMIIFGLVFSALTNVLMGLLNRIELFYLGAAFVGLFANAGGPAQQAMVADLLPEEKRAQGFGLIRVVANLAVTIGPAIGGLLAARSYFLLFVGDAIFSSITAAIVAFVIPETRPDGEQETEETLGQTFRGYVVPLKDRTFVLFIVASILMAAVAMQMTTTLPVYLRDVHNVSEQRFGYVLSLNAALVVLFQFSVTRWISGARPLWMMALGSLLYGLGFSLYGFVSIYALFLFAIAIATLGEMITSPTGQALAARFAPEAMRGRYMAIYGFSWVIPSATAPLIAGWVMDHVNPQVLWYGAGVVGLVAAFAFLALGRTLRTDGTQMTAD